MWIWQINFSTIMHEDGEMVRFDCTVDDVAARIESGGVNVRVRIRFDTVLDNRPLVTPFCYERRAVPLPRENELTHRVKMIGTRAADYDVLPRVISCNECEFMASWLEPGWSRDCLQQSNSPFVDHYSNPFACLDYCGGAPRIAGKRRAPPGPCVDRLAIDYV